MSAKSLVVDASVTAAWLLPDEASAASRHVYSQVRKGAVDLHAPDLWLWECGNVIANAVKRRRLSAPDAVLTWSVLDAVRTRVAMTAMQTAQVRAALVIAIDHSLSIYDATYLWLAVSSRLPLLSHDRMLAAAAERLSVAVVRLEELA